MGKEWNGSRSLTRGENENPGCMSGMLHYLDFHHLLFTSGHGVNCGSGMVSINRALPLSSPSPSPRVSHVSNSQFKGLEAPRNSLEMDDGKVAMSTLAMKEEFYVDVPVGIQVAPVASSSASSKKSTMVSEEEKRSSSSQGETPRTPSVVARLMGLEVLPDQGCSPGACSPRTPPLVGKNKQSRAGNGDKKELLPQRQPLRSLNCSLPTLPQLRSIIDISSSVSLPETPRASVSSTRSSDTRLSLQLNKDNSCNDAKTEFRYLCQAPGDYSLPTSPSACAAAKSRRKHCYVSETDENKSPSSHYCARDIVKQLKETISSTRSGGIERNGETRAKLKMSSSSVKMKGDYDEEAGKQTMPSVVKPQVPPTPPPPRPSAKLPVPEFHKAKGGEDRVLLPHICKEISSAGRDDRRIERLSTVLPNRCRKAAFERFTAKIKKQSLEKGNNNRQPSFSQSLPALALTEKETSGRKEASSLPSRPSPSPSQEHVIKVGSSSSPLSYAQQTRQPCEQGPEYRYLKSILERADVTAGSSATPSLGWHSPALPVDPVLFHQLELELELQVDDVDDECRRRCLGPLCHRWNRKLLFHVVEEISADLLLEWSDRPSSATLADYILGRESSRGLHLLSRSGKSCGRRLGEPLLLRQLWVRIRSLPEADCRVVGDIDALALGDLSGANTRRLLRHPSVVEETEDVVADVEQELVDSLIEEAAAWLAFALPLGPSCRRWC